MAWITAAHDLLHTPAGIGAIGGLLAAARVDYAAFRQWDTWHDLTDYSWGIASWRWTQGTIIGALSALGVAAVL